MSWLGTDADLDAERMPQGDDILRTLDGAIERCERLPVVDRALQRVLTLAEREEASLGELVEALEEDPGLAANVLRFANSAAVSPRMPIRTVRQAAAMVGRTGVRRLALDSAAYRFFERVAGSGGGSLGQMHLHAVTVSRLAVLCAEHAGIPTDRPHLAGLLHDCGRIVMPVAFGETALDAVASACPHGGARAWAELDRFGADHAQAGALFARACGVDEEIVRAISWHHGGDDGSVVPSRLAACLQIADQVAEALGGAPLSRELCERALAVLGLPDEILDDLAHAARAASGAAAPDGESPLVARLRELDEMARVDELTGVASRRQWLATVRERLDAGERGGIVIVDVDGFAAVRAEHGPNVTDVLLCEIARLAAGTGYAGRVGIDELAVWIADEPSRTLEAAEHIVRSVRGAIPGGRGVSISAGAATTHGGISLSILLSRADTALEQARREGRDRAVAADTELAV